jgi:osmotically-inducible protein OsmY
MQAMKFVKAIVAVLILCNMVYGCAALVIGGGAAAGGAAIYSRRTAGTMVDDEGIELSALKRLAEDKQINGQVHVNIISYNAVVLLVGQAPTEELRNRTESIVSGIDKVRLVHNEMTIAAPNSLTARSADTITTSKVKTSILGVTENDDSLGLRTKVVTENGIVYLMGLLSRQEADAVTNAARQVGGVQRVVKLFEYTD